MPNYPIHTIALAPENSKPALEQLEEASPGAMHGRVGLFFE